MLGASALFMFRALPDSPSGWMSELANFESEGEMPGTESFDLNIDDMLSHWEVSDALRELIANAIDESRLSGTPEPDIAYDVHGKTVSIRDWGRGLEVEHLVQNESREKFDAGFTIGRFGVGLKDALESCMKTAAVLKSPRVI